MESARRPQRAHPDYFETHSLQIASYLVAKHGVMPRIGGGRRRALFYFHDPEGQMMWDAGYLFTADDPVGAKSLFAAMQQLRLAIDELFGRDPKH